MTAFKVSAIGGPILLIVSGCLDGSGAWCEWHWNWLHTSGEMSRPKSIEHEFRYMTNLLNLYNLLNTIKSKIN